MNKLVSILVCSRNRAHEIINCLPGLAEQANEFNDVEVIVVDNGSTDNTEEVVRKASQKFHYNFRYVFEATPGLCQARNTGRHEANGEVIAYVDDDVIIAPGWVKSIREHFLKNKSDCLGGRVSIKMNGRMPFKLEPEMQWFFMASTLGENPRLLSYPQHPIGCNMAFKTKVFDAIGGFNTNLKLYGDETDFFERVYMRGFSVYYDPDVEVTQIIPPERLTKSALKEKSFKWGQGAATAYLLQRPTPVELKKRKVEFKARTVYMALMSGIRRNFGGFYTYWYNRGYLAQLNKGLEENKFNTTIKYIK